MMKVAFTLLVFVIFLLGFQESKGQNLLSSNKLELLLDKAEFQAQNYGKVFQNLSAEELKTKLYYKKNGQLDEKRLIKSIFVVYQSPNNRRAQEFRNVIEFNSKDVRRSDKQVAKFFEKLAKTKTTKKEYTKIRKEGIRYDGRIVSWGMTLSQTRPFHKTLRKDFKFQLIGKETIDENSVWKIDYEQIKASPYIFSNPTKEEIHNRKNLKIKGIEYSTNISNAFRPTNPLMKGTIWLDVATAQIRKNKFEIVFHPQRLTKPITAIELMYEYQSSEFAILVPKKFLIRSFKILGKNDKTLFITKDSESIYEYSNFKKFKTEVDNYEVK